MVVARLESCDLSRVGHGHPSGLRSYDVEMLVFEEEEDVMTTQAQVQPVQTRDHDGQKKM
jgi:hypothetical protein